MHGRLENNRKITANLHTNMAAQPGFQRHATSFRSNSLDLWGTSEMLDTVSRRCSTCLRRSDAVLTRLGTDCTKTRG